MEQKKTLWIIASVGAFLLIVLGIAWFNYTPRGTVVPTVISRSQSESLNNGWTNQQTQVPVPSTGFENKRADEVVVITDNTTVIGKNNNSDGTTTIDLNSLKNELISAQQEINEQNKVAAVPATQVVTEQPVAVPQNINITVNVPEYKTEVTNKIEPKPFTKFEHGKKDFNKNSEKTESVKVKASPKVVVNNDSKANVKVAVAAPKTEKIITQYWVQVAAYGSKKAAEAARSVLDENRIPADIFTYEDNKGKLFFRVRVGPYTTKSEAEYWRTRINKIDTFAKAESYVTSTTKTE
jgi:cell division protein FtsN